MNILMSISSFNPQTVFLRVSTTICTQHNTEIPHNIVLAVGSLNLLNVNSCFNKEGGGITSYKLSHRAFRFQRQRSRPFRCKIRF